jgi:tripartite-type tricarboxylate transporter receptor subunit TctC
MKAWLRMAAVSACLAAVPNADAETYPSKPITIIVPAPPGGVTDMLARILAQHCNADWGAQTVVENKPGANNQVAAEYVMHQPGDGYTPVTATRCSSPRKPPSSSIPRFTPTCATSSPISPRSPVSCKSIMR